MQDCITRDGINVTASLAVRYRIERPDDYWIKLRDDTEGIKCTAKIVTATHIQRYNFDEIKAGICEFGKSEKGRKEDKRNIFKDMRYDLGDMTKDYGLDVLMVGFSTFTNAPPFRVLQNCANEISL